MEQFKQRLLQQDIQQLRRQPPVIDYKNDKYIFINKQKLLNFSSNDYLGIANHSAVKKAMIDGIDRYGLGSSASALVSGYHQSHRKLEEQFAAYMKCEDALLFNSGYVANIGICQAFANRHCHFIVDKLCHASLIDGIRLTCAKYHRFLHNNCVHAEQLITANLNQKSVITESVFSISGDLAPIEELVKLTKKYQSVFVVDDSHGAFVVSKPTDASGIDCTMISLGKAFGSMGAMVSGTKEIIAILRQFARSYCYSTALPPAIAHAGLTCLSLCIDEEWRREKLHGLIHYFLKLISQYSLKLKANDNTPIKAIVVPNNETGLLIQKQLRDKGFYLALIRTPTVSKKETYLRISLTAMHDEADIQSLLEHLSDVYQKQ